MYAAELIRNTDEEFGAKLQPDVDPGEHTTTDPTVPRASAVLYQGQLEKLVDPRAVDIHHGGSLHVEIP